MREFCRHGCVALPHRNGFTVFDPNGATVEHRGQCGEFEVPIISRRIRLGTSNSKAALES
jgi:hypothetical protein